MTNHSLLSISLLAACAAPLSAQIVGPGASDYVGEANVFFTMDGTVAVNSTTTGNEAGVIADEGIMSFSPGVDAFARAYCDFGLWSSYFGDEDGDGAYTDSIITSVDAIWLRANNPGTPSLHDLYFSVQTPVDPGGFLGAPVSDGDMVRIRRDGSLETFLSQADVISAMGGASTNVDINGFTVDQSNGDLYMTFTAGVDVNGTAMADGGIMLIPGSAYTLAGGVVTAMTPNTAVVALTDADVSAIFMAVTGDNISDCTGIEIDPTGGTFMSPSTGLTLPHLWLADDDGADDSIISTKVAIPTVNGVPLTAGPGMGLTPLNPFGSPNGNPFGIAFVAQNPAPVRPMIVDQFPSSFPAPAMVNVDIAGASPTSAVFLILEIFNATPMGGFPARLGGLGALLAPTPLAPTSLHLFFGPGSAATIPLITDAEGFATFPLSLPPLTANIGLTWQAVDLGTFNFSAPTTAEVN
ncbi:MAG: hypothetical protein AAF196_12185 [Planctomycetota bacterium]